MPLLLFVNSNMKIKHFVGFIGMTMIVFLGLSFTSCSSSSDDIEPYMSVNGMASADITFAGVFENKSGIDFKQIVKVASNVSWTVSGKPDWLSISPSNGNGNIDITIYPTSENETSSPRTATITLTGTDITATINVTQEAGKPVCYTEIRDEVVLHNIMAWEYKATSNVNTYQWILLSEGAYNRLTNNELLEELAQQEKFKVVDKYINMVSRDSYGNKIMSNTTYYIVTVATDANGKTGELWKKKLVTPIEKDTQEDALVSFSDVTAGIYSGFQFTATKEGYCNTYHLIYGTLPSGLYYEHALYAFEINYYLKYKKKHWFTEDAGMEIVTDYPNNHTFSTYYSSYSSLCIAYAWGVFKDGTLSSNITGIQWDPRIENTMRKVGNSSEETKGNVLIIRSEVKRQLSGKMRR